MRRPPRSFPAGSTASTTATCCASRSCRRPHALIVDWETRARRLAAEFRADSIRHLTDAPTRALIDALTAGSDAFAQYWASQDVFEREGGLREFDHPADGRLVYQQITLKPAHRETSSWSCWCATDATQKLIVAVIVSL